MEVPITMTTPITSMMPAPAISALDTIMALKSQLEAYKLEGLE